MDDDDKEGKIKSQHASTEFARFMIKLEPQ